VTTVLDAATTSTVEDAPVPRPRPRWERPALAALLGATALLYLWGLGASGDANSFYAAAVQAGTKSWKALFFGSFDSGNFITVDKPPASLWIMALSGRVFGFNSWSMLVPQALEGVAAVGLLYAAVRRWYGAAAGLIAGAVLALTPVAVLMFRFNNPDALLTLLLVAGGYAMVRATESASTRWVMLAGAAVGFGFLTKMLQAVLVLPAFGVMYLIAAPTSLRRRILQLGAGLAAVVVSAGWWVAIVQLWPASSRPYIGGSTTNSVLELAFGYNGLGRITGSEGGPGGGGAGGGGGGGNIGFGGVSGAFRLFGESMGTQVSWLLPAALIALVVLAWRTRATPRTDRTRASLLLWGGWLLVTGAVFSYMQGIIHPYYTVALAPSIAGLVGIGAVRLWQERQAPAARGGLAAMVAATGVWGFVLLGRTPDWHPELRYAVLVVGLAAAAALLIRGVRVAVAASVAALTALLGTGAYALDTAATVHTGSIPSAGPATAGGDGGPGGFGGGGADFAGGPGGGTRSFEGLGGQGGLGGPGGGLAPNLATPQSGGGRGGPAGGGTADAAVVALLRATTTRWAAAASGSQGAAPLELASGKAIMAIGGFSGGDPAPTLAQFQAYVAAGEVRYFIGGGSGGGPGGRGGDDIGSWVAANFTATTVGGQTVYDLTKPVTS
jgi:4-amino-4-deoxy-L-arabinose transferase-like glycosyltransferase